MTTAPRCARTVKRNLSASSEDVVFYMFLFMCKQRAARACLGVVGKLACHQSRIEPKFTSCSAQMESVAQKVMMLDASAQLYIPACSGNHIATKNFMHERNLDFVQRLER
uniref:Uncharacterized protein n=1 Tax=Lotharella globosa TaxID=91324 RepID=A0A7S3Z1H1_9EUKA|mmetsp:Transcript_18339/g.37028  ORF Transcript_18339/g.37028 Transcript_18339/m.37028 type:complete len:110 (+) Transcript_18339:909-1238(+)